MFNLATLSQSVNQFLSPRPVRTSGPAGGAAVVDGEQRLAAGFCGALAVTAVEPGRTHTKHITKG